ncbi:hypothetical protein AAG570_008039 [Ranatra chinensis]|uniref:Vesicle transport protein USE1 n=1 Tax=Ranatra chinensis TaxID=642074 RepID=A0ABD0XTK9_9HEMI
MVLSRKEITIKRLLAKCEFMLKSDSRGQSQLIKLVGSLEGMIADLRNSPEKPFDHVLSSYCERLELLKGSIQAEWANSEDLRAGSQISSSLKGLNDDPKIMQRKLEGQSLLELRQHLLSGDNIRKRMGTVQERDTPSSDYQLHSTDVDDYLKYHNSLQENIADNMIALVQSMVIFIKVMKKKT